MLSALAELKVFAKSLNASIVRNKLKYIAITLNHPSQMRTPAGEFLGRGGHCSTGVTVGRPAPGGQALVVGGHAPLVGGSAPFGQALVGWPPGEWTSRTAT